MRTKLGYWALFAVLCPTTIVVAQVQTDNAGNYRLNPTNPNTVPQGPRTFTVGNAYVAGQSLLNVRGDLLSGTNQTPEVFRTNAPTTGLTYWRMFQGGTTAGFERGQLFADPANTNFNINAPNGDLRLYTSSVRRLNILPTTTGIVVNGFVNQTLSGNVGVGSFANLPGNQPLSMLHLDRAATQVAGYRPWMQVGTTMTQGSDWMYVGLKQAAQQDRTDAVINWADNDQFNPNWGPDALRFIFTKDPVLGDIAGTLNGLEIARRIPDSNGSEGYVGIGDFNTPQLLPNERLDILTRTARLRRLVPDYNNDTIGRIVVVDTTGRLHWRRISTFPTGGGGGGTGCEWTLSGGVNGNNVWTAVGTGSACPNYDNLVGIGTSSPVGKLHTKWTGTAQNSYGGYFELDGTGLGKAAGTFRTSGSGGAHIGSEAIASGALSENFYYGNIGASGKAQANASGTGVSNRGVAAWGEVGASNTLTHNMGVDSYTFVQGGGNVTNNYGVYSYALNYGASANNYGGRFYSYAPNSTVGYGVWAQSEGAATNWAGYFAGDVQAGASYLPCDAQLKSNVEQWDVSRAQDVLSALDVHYYTYNNAAFPQMQLPVGPQVGLVAHEVEQVLPSLVKNATHPVAYDHDGNVVSEAVDFKAVNYVGLIPYLIAGYQAQNARIAQLEQSLASCCATHGSGDQRMMIEDSGTITGEARSLRIVPNPFNEGTTLHYTLEKAGRMQLLANSADGKQLKVLHEAQQEAGTYQHAWSTTELSPGVYYVTLLLDGEPIVKRAVKVVR